MDFKESDLYRVIVLPDIHLPEEDEKALSAVEKFMKDNTFDEWLQLGDFLDFDYISKYTKDNLKLISESRIKKDYDHANGFLDRHQKIVRDNNPDAHFTILQGNHDYRIDLLIQKDPRFEGLVEMETNLRFEERGILYWKHWTTQEPYRIGKANFIHGASVAKHHTAKTVADYNHSIFYGHSHTVECTPKRNYGHGDTIVGQSLGFLAKYGPGYMGGKPSEWQHAFAVFYFTPDGFFWYYPILIFQGRFVAPDGTIYEGDDPE